MAKKSKAAVKAPAGAAPANVEPEVGKKIVELKAEGNRAFATGDYAKALTTYDSAITLLPANAPERVDFHNNKAACFIGQKSGGGGGGEAPLRSSPFALKYVDKSSDRVTLTCKADIHLALSELVQQYQRQPAPAEEKPKAKGLPSLERKAKK
ncbi:hypothetical protein TSOC_005551 [Tetrabaena socialis]|uniref:Uncharacterized protein n=1 Tax=Tetrabaena socialis TaxID=47790 RepID=A0A2J8A5Y1_9CHLO|nr:hypothetical protein TSOC_005551 [Tetrabaena socialis]|eukprot:PNH07936.1 hypothetical protein TSOC_005551 [Tetrabaena socialis]